jgi:hypothetical protein
MLNQNNTFVQPSPGELFQSEPYTPLAHGHWRSRVIDVLVKIQIFRMANYLLLWTKRQINLSLH